MLGTDDCHSQTSSFPKVSLQILQSTGQAGSNTVESPHWRSSMVRKHSPRRCRLREVGPRGVFEAFKRSKNPSLENVSADADIISFDLFESGFVFSQLCIHDLSGTFFCPKKCSKNLCSQTRSEIKV